MGFVQSICNREPGTSGAGGGLSATWGGTLGWGMGWTWAQPGGSGSKRRNRGQHWAHRSTGRQEGPASHRWSVRPAAEGGAGSAVRPGRSLPGQGWAEKLEVPEPRALGAGPGCRCAPSPPRPCPSSPAKRTGRKMSAGLCAVLLRLPQLPSVEANAVANGRAGRGRAGRALVAARDRPGPLLEDPVRRVVERTASPGGGWGQRWLPASLVTLIRSSGSFHAPRPEAGPPLPCQPGPGSGPAPSSCMRRPGSPPAAHDSLKVPPAKSSGHGVRIAVCLRASLLSKTSHMWVA